MPAEGAIGLGIAHFRPRPLLDPTIVTQRRGSPHHRSCALSRALVGRLVVVHVIVEPLEVRPHGQRRRPLLERDCESVQLREAGQRGEDLRIRRDGRIREWDGRIRVSALGGAARRLREWRRGECTCAR